MEDRTSRFGLDPFTGRATALWQGTIISDLARQLRLVVSADCDLAPTKRAGSFFYLDVLTTETFVTKYAVPDSVRDRHETLLDAAKEIAAKRSAAFEKVGKPVLDEWLRKGGRERWSSDLQGAHPAELDLLDALAVAARSLTDEPSEEGESEDPEGRVDSIYISCSNDQQSNKTAQINKKLRALLAARLQSSRLDHFILPEMPGEASAGHFVPFRSIQEMKRSEVCENRIELAEFPSKFYPVAACRPVLLQALLQRFSTYFMRIGFTEQFKTQQDQVVNATLEAVK